MSQKRLSMRKIREVLRLKFELRLDNRQIAKCCKISHVTVGNYLARFAAAGLSWPLPAEMDDGQFIRRSVRRPGPSGSRRGHCRTRRDAAVSCAARA